MDEAEIASLHSPFSPINTHAHWAFTFIAIVEYGSLLTSQRCVASQSYAQLNSQCPTKARADARAHLVPYMQRLVDHTSEPHVRSLWQFDTGMFTCYFLLFPAQAVLLEALMKVSCRCSSPTVPPTSR